jgi:hypothetical protein
MRFPEFAIPLDSKRERTVVARKLKSALLTLKQNSFHNLTHDEIERVQLDLSLEQEKSEIFSISKLPYHSEGQIHHLSSGLRAELVYLTAFPLLNEHRGHEIGGEANTREPLDKRVSKYLKTQIQAGVVSPKELMTLSKTFVSDVIFKGCIPPDMPSKRFYPDRKTISNILHSVKLQSQKNLSFLGSERSVERDKVVKLKHCQKHPQELEHSFVQGVGLNPIGPIHMSSTAEGKESDMLLFNTNKNVNSGAECFNPPLDIKGKEIAQHIEDVHTKQTKIRTTLRRMDNLIQICSNSNLLDKAFECLTELDQQFSSDLGIT